MVVHKPMGHITAVLHLVHARLCVLPFLLRAHFTLPVIVCCVKMLVAYTQYCGWSSCCSASMPLSLHRLRRHRVSVRICHGRALRNLKTSQFSTQPEMTKGTNVRQHNGGHFGLRLLAWTGDASGMSLLLGDSVAIISNELEKQIMAL